MCYNEIGMCAWIIETILETTWNKTGNAYVINERIKKG